MNATLIRHQGDGCILGVLVLDNGFACQTLELPWRDNAPNVSCIPQGHYTVIPHRSPTKGDCFAVLDVPARTDILIHAGNWPKDTLGCILVGLERGPDDASVLHSQVALRELRQHAPDSLRLRIIGEVV